MLITLTIVKHFTIYVYIKSTCCIPYIGKIYINFKKLNNMGKIDTWEDFSLDKVSLY